MLPRRTSTIAEADPAKSLFRVVLYAATAFIIAFGTMAWDIERAGIAQPYSDPISHIRAQDEAVHVNAAIRMTTDGDWLTPKVMGRWFLFKPPFLVWLSALSIRIFGLSLFAVRLPALVCGAAGAAAVFVWTARSHSVAAGILASGFLISSTFWQTFSRLCYTDVPAVSLAGLALTGVALDPQIRRRTTAVVFGILAAAAILAKSIAGALPFAVLLLYLVAAPAERRPRPERVLLAILVACIIVAPWYIYQIVVHPQWLWADHIQVQLIGVGFRSARSGIFDQPLLYYLRRLGEMDPILAGSALLAVTLRLLVWRRRPQELLALCWMTVTILALCAFQAKNLPYIVFLLPSLCILGGIFSASLLRHRAKTASAVVALLFFAKAVAIGYPWSLRPTAPPIVGSTAMRAYYDLHRRAELIAVDPDDEFYAITIPLPHVRYCFLDPSGLALRFAPHYKFLGIALTAEQFVALPTLQPQFERRLRAWGSSPEAIGAAITLRAPSELTRIIQARPESDFYFPSSWILALSQVEETHRFVAYSTERMFLLSRLVQDRTLPVSPIPDRW